MPRIFKILVLPGGSEIGLEIQKSLRYCRDIKLFSAGTAVPNHAPFVYENHFVVKSIHEKGWEKQLKAIMAANKIDYIFPAYDDIQMALYGTKLPMVSHPYATGSVARSKSATYKMFKDTIPCPESYDAVYQKPDKGQGSENNHLIKSEDLLLEYLPGAEYTVDCFTAHGGLLYCRGRRRNRIRGGIAVNSTPVELDVFSDYAQRIMNKLEFTGAWFFQLKEDKAGSLKLLEIGTRIGGTMATDRVNGVNLPLLSIYLKAGIPFEVMPQDNYRVVDRALVNRYQTKLSYTTVYVDYDDTVVHSGGVNTDLIKFLYQCANAGVEIVLVTRHVGSLDASMKRHRISKNLFDKIVQLDPRKKKSSAIKHKASIFIDDSFRERQEVANACFIPVFDCSMLELLIDDRC